MVNARISNVTPSARVSQMGTQGTVITHPMFSGKGYPIGLLLALTYTAQQAGTVSSTTVSGKPNARILNT